MVDQVGSGQAGNTTEEEDDFLSFFEDEPKEPQESEEGGGEKAGEEGVPVFPATEDIPKEFQGLPMTPENVTKLAKVARDLQGEYTRARQQLSEVTKNLESGDGKASFGDIPDPAAAALSTTLEAVTDLRLELALSQDEVAAKYKDEVKQALQNVDPSLRADPGTISAAIAFVKGKHFDEVLAERMESRKEESGSAGGEAPPKHLGGSTGPPPVGGGKSGKSNDEIRKMLDGMPESKRRNLLAWADGDVNRLKQMLGG